MKIITTTLEDFINREIAEHGHDYVEAQFLCGYEPCLINGVWCWYAPDLVFRTVHAIDNNSNSSIHNSSYSQPVCLV